MKRHSYEYVKNVIEKKGGELLSKEYINNAQKLLVVCKNGHQWNIAFSKVISGRWCPDCANQKMASERKFTYGFVKEWISDRGGELLSKEYCNGKQLLSIKCGKGHVWKARFNNIKNMNRWCHFCGGTKKLTLKDAIDVAKEKGGKCLSGEYVNSVFSKLYWECGCGFRWHATLNNVKIHNKWCPKCASGKSQKFLFRLLKNIFDKEQYCFFYNYRGFDWLNTKGDISQEIDIFIKSKNDNFSLAVEYDGKQHFEPVGFFGGCEKFLYQKRLDEIKNEKILKHKEDVKYFVRVPYWEELSEENIKYMLVCNGVKI